MVGGRSPLNSTLVYGHFFVLGSVLRSKYRQVQRFKGLGEGQHFPGDVGRPTFPGPIDNSYGTYSTCDFFQGVPTPHFGVRA